MGDQSEEGARKGDFFPPFPLPSPAVSSSFHPSFSYTCILTCVRSLILCVFVRRPRSEGSNWRKRRRFVEKQAIRRGLYFFFFLFSFPSSFQVWPSFALWPVYVRVGFIKSYHLVAFIQWRIFLLLKQKKKYYIPSLLLFQFRSRLFHPPLLHRVFEIQTSRHRNNHSVSLTTSRDGKLYTSQWRNSATSSRRVYRLPDDLKIVCFTDRS